MINKEEFLKTCNLTEDDLTAARISWEELTEIYEDYMSKTKLFRHLGKEFVDEYIYDIERAGIHSYRYRTKNPMHLLEKIIRKRKENYAKFEHINKSNYHKYITDLLVSGFSSFTGRTGSIFISSSLRCLKMIRTIM